MVSVVVAAISVVASGLMAATSATAVNTPHDRVVNPAPAASTPWANDGRVFAIVQVGNTVIAGGSFTSVSGPGGSPTLSRNRIMAFNATTGAILSTFNPTLNGDVNALLPGPVANSVLVGGAFTTVNGVASRGLTLLDATTGARITSFAVPSMNGIVNDMASNANRLYIGGYFTSVGGQPHGGLAVLNRTTGAVDHAFLNVTLTENHNWTAGSTGAKASVGARALDVAPDGGTLVVIGNFRKANGLERDQAVLIETGGATGVVADWRTRRYEPACFSGAFDSYQRDIDISPDGSYFVIVNTGGPNPGTLCDTAARWETAGRGDAIEPTWVDDTGGDTLWSVAITGTAVYTGGHQRWMNNAGGTDNAAPGAVPRPGLGAMDPETGIPLSWNPGRNPRGAGAFALYSTPQGLWMGSDTEWIGTFDYRRPRIAFFPITGGQVLPEGETGDLPGSVLMGGEVSGAASSGVLFRVNAGGPTLPAIDGGPDWIGDDSATSPYRNAGSNGAGWSPVPDVDSTVPVSTPPAVFDSERWDPGDAPEMDWSIPIPAGTEVDVRVYLANRCSCTSGAGQRVFDVSLEGSTMLDDFDIVAAVGDQRGTMRESTVTSDGAIDIGFGHVVENPLVNAIEIVEAGSGGEPESGVLHRVNAGGPAMQSLDSGPDWRADDTASSAFRNSGSNAAPWGPVPSVDGTVPATTPLAVFDSERWDPSGPPELQWSFPVAAGTAVDVRVYLANRCGCTSAVGQRVFDVSLEGATVLNDFDIVAAVGDQRGTMRQWTVTSDGIINIDLGHVVENPLVNAIEIVEAGFDPGADVGGTLRARPYDGVGTTGPTVVVPGADVPWNLVRGAVRIDDTLFYGLASGMLHRRAYDGTNFGPAQAIDPYNDPEWSNVDTGSGGTFRGVRPTFYSELGNVTGMAFRDGKLYYTLFGQPGLYYRLFSPDSGIVSPERFQVSGAALPQIAGMFLSGDGLYYAARNDGSLWRVDFASGAPSGAPVRLSGPGIDGLDWRARALFVGEGTPPPPENEPPTAAFTVSCEELACDLDGSGSSDPDGTIESYAWNFGDGDTDSGETVSHTFDAPGTYLVTLTVTDDDDATDAASQSVSVSEAGGAEVTFRAAAASNSNTANPSVTVPAAVQAGDGLLLFVSINKDGLTVGTPAGWTLVGEQSAAGAMKTLLYQRTAGAGDAGSTVSTPLSVTSKVDITVLAFDRTGGGNPVAQFASAAGASATSRTTPSFATSGAGLVASYWADKSSAVTDWTPPAGQQVRSESIGTGTGYVTSLATDNAVQVVSGASVGGLTATTDVAGSRATMWTVLIAP